MRRIITIIVLSLFCTGLKAQDDPLVELCIDFSSIDTSLYIDTSLPNNQWEIGIPNKPNFDSAYSSPNAICTDLDSDYNPNTTSAFQLMVISEIFGSGSLEFIHKFDTELEIAGGFIEISYDQGNSWNNLVYESYWRENSYESTDVLFNYEPGFTGITDGWVKVKFHFSWYQLTKKYNTWPIGWGLGQSGDADTLLLNFNFVSNSTATGKPGWLIDDLNFKVFDFGGNTQNLHKTDYKITYNPMINKVFVNCPVNNSDNYSIMIYDIQGRKRIMDSNSPSNIDVAILENGVYLLCIENEGNFSCVKKILIH